ncbi:MAG: radical SAM protein [Defluviitaleaceae bacterium]|nr:radical SAM protein [Defluviitaleaceae bacterium]
MLKKSNYNIEVETLSNGNKLIFNTITSLFSIMDVPSQNIYENIEKININTVENDEDKRNISLMKKAGYIIDKNINELDCLNLMAKAQRFSNKTLSLTIATTMDCNMACPYCYENRVEKYMTEEIQEAVYKFSENYIKMNNCKNLGVTWYGGEPLMNKDAIYNLSEKFIKLCEELEISYAAGIVTNGALLDRETGERLKEYKVSFAQITIDGMPEFHNKRRILRDGRDSFDIIVNNIESCKDLFNISVRINVDKENLSSLDELTNFFYNEKKWVNSPSFYLAPVRDDNDDYDVTKTTCFYGNEFSSIDMENLKKKSQYDRNSIKYAAYPRVRGNFCGGDSLSGFVVGPDGYLYKCWNEADHIDKNIGSVTNGLSFNGEHTKWLLIEPQDKCLECKFYPICRGGCPLKYFDKNDAECLHTIHNLTEKLKFAYEDYIASKEKVAEAV